MRMLSVLLLPLSVSAVSSDISHRLSKFSFLPSRAGVFTLIELELIMSLFKKYFITIICYPSVVVHFKQEDLTIIGIKRC